jgi:rhomboid family GlyGly-CTERM serine protease
LEIDSAAKVMTSAVINLARQLAKTSLTLTIGLAALLVAFFPGLSEALEYDRMSIVGGEIWRLLSCHLTHWNAEHLQWDLLMFLALGGLCELRSAKSLRICVISSAAAVSATVFFWFPDVGQYRGLSGIDTALFTLLAIQLISQARRERSWRRASVVAGLLVGFVAKTVYEGIMGQTIFVDESLAGFVPLVWDHLAGAVVGAIVALCDLAAATPSRANTAGPSPPPHARRAGANPRSAMAPL